jgi:hypothetical protein
MFYDLPQSIDLPIEVTDKVRQHIKLGMIRTSSRPHGALFIDRAMNLIATKIRLIGMNITATTSSFWPEYSRRYSRVGVGASVILVESRLHLRDGFLKVS